MARKVFFSFHFGEDAQRAGVVRNHGVTKDGLEDAGYIDAAQWEALERQGDDAIRRWINQQMTGTSVTVVLIGQETAYRPWVQYEISQSRSNGRKNGVLGVHIHNIRDWDKRIGIAGPDPFTHLGWKGVRVYDWVNDDGYNNFASWVEAAANQQWND